MDIEKRNPRDQRDGREGVDRRRFLRGSLVGGAALAAVAAAGPASLLPEAFAQEGPSKFPSPDEKIIAFMQIFEKAAVEAYQTAAAKLTDASATSIATSYMGHHKDEALALGKVLKQSESQSDKIEADPALAATYKSQLSGAADQNATLEVLLKLEESLAATYLDALNRFDVGYNAGAVASILPVTSQHAAVLGTLMSQPLSSVLAAQIPISGAVDLASPAVQSPTTTTTTTTAPAGATSSSTTTQPGGSTP